MASALNSWGTKAPRQSAEYLDMERLLDEDTGDETEAEDRKSVTSRPFRSALGRTLYESGNRRVITWLLVCNVCSMVALAGLSAAFWGRSPQGDRTTSSNLRLETAPSCDLTPTSASCDPPATRLMKLERLYGMDDYEGRAWLEHINSFDDRDLAPLGKVAHKFIHDWQNPPLEDCSSKTFYTPEFGTRGGHGYGLGATIHILTFAMRNAMEMGAILAWPETAMGMHFVDEACLVDGIRSLDCVFEPLTHCPRSTFVNRVNGSMIDDSNSKAILPTGEIVDHTEVPTALKAMLAKAMPYELTSPAQKNWWRGQGAAYLMRLNRASLAHIRSARFNASQHYMREIDLLGVHQEKAMPWPLPRGTLSFHIRHGDKAQEMTLVPFKDYAVAGERLANTNPYGYQKFAFISSEDPDVFKEAESVTTFGAVRTTPNQNWRWYGSHINRINGGPQKQLNAFGSQTLTTLSWMSELMIAMECDAFIGTRGSNWNRIIDELRCVWIDSCRGPYVEVGPDKDWGDYNW